MHMTPITSGMSKQPVTRLLTKVTIVALLVLITVFGINTKSYAYGISGDPTYSSYSDWVADRYRGHKHETWDKKIARLIQSKIDDAGGLNKVVADNQIRCVAENIYYESRGESITGQLAVAKVTMNRFNEGYANTLCGVVKQRNPAGCQFAWVCDRTKVPPHGYLWYQAAGIASLVVDDPDALEDPTNGATHFHATYIAWRSSFKRVKDSVSQIGNHVFYRIKPREQ